MTTLTESDLEVAPRTYDSPTIAVGESDLLDLLKERDHLRKQVAELQEDSTKKLEGSLYRQVRYFHQKFGHPVRHTPTIPPEDEVRFRLRLITEEYLELMAACFREGPIALGIDALEDRLREIINQAALRVDIVEFADAMADLDYVVEGGRAVFGIIGKPIADEVQRANMAKDANGPDGKPVKPADWSPPDVRGCLLAQGWQPPAPALGAPWSPPVERPLVGVRRVPRGLPSAAEAASTAPPPPEPGSELEVHADTVAASEES